MKNKTIMITGGCGYIGSNTVKYLHEIGYTTIVVDIVDNPNVQLYADYLYNVDYGTEDCFDLFKKHEIDGIVHCAGTSLVGPSISDPIPYYENNVVKTFKFLNAIKTIRTKPIPIVFSSSASVYGEPITQNALMDENHPLKPISPYGHTKLIIENMLKDYDNAYGFPHVSLRYFNAAGATPNLGQKPNATHIIAKLFECWNNKQIFTINGNNYNTYDGTCIRDYIHVVDIANAHFKSLEYIMNGGKSECINLGTERGFSNLEIVNAFAQHVGFIGYSYGYDRIGDPAFLVASAKKAKKIIDWTPQNSDVKNIMISAFEWYNSDAYKQFLK